MPSRGEKCRHPPKTHTVKALHFLSLNTYITLKLKQSFYLLSSAQTSQGSSSLLSSQLFVYENTCILPKNPRTSPPNTDYAYTLMKPSPNILAVNCKVCLTVSRARKPFQLCNRLNDTPGSLRAEAGRCSIKCHKSYLLPARPHAKIHLSRFTSLSGESEVHTLTDTHSHTCTDCECSPHTELFSFHYVFHRKLPPLRRGKKKEKSFVTF